MLRVHPSILPLVLQHHPTIADIADNSKSGMEIWSIVLVVIVLVTSMIVSLVTTMVLVNLTNRLIVRCSRPFLLLADFEP